MFKSAICLPIFVMLISPSVDAQKTPGRSTRKNDAQTKINAAETQSGREKVTDDEGELEATTWEYKVIDTKSKQTLSKGKLRFKKNGIYAVSTKKKSNDDANLKSDANGADAELDSKEDSVDERIGEIVMAKRNTRKRNKYTFRFDKDDEHELSGIAVVNRDRKNNEIWLGHYTEGKRKRWRFELRSENGSTPDR